MNIKDFLDQLNRIKWFENSGVPSEKYEVIFSVFEAYDDWNEKMFTAWDPNITMLERRAIEEIGDEEIDSIFSTISSEMGEVLYRKWGEFMIRQHLEEEAGLEDEMMDRVKRDLAWAYIEQMLIGQGFFTTLLEIYKSGYFPCSWVGIYPNGRAVVL